MGERRQKETKTTAFCATAALLLTVALFLLGALASVYLGSFNEKVWKKSLLTSEYGLQMQEELEKKQEVLLEENGFPKSLAEEAWEKDSIYPEFLRFVENRGMNPNRIEKNEIKEVEAEDIKKDTNVSKTKEIQQDKKSVTEAKENEKSEIDETEVKETKQDEIKTAEGITTEFLLSYLKNQGVEETVAVKEAAERTAKESERIYERYVHPTFITEYFKTAERVKQKTKPLFFVTIAVTVLLLLLFYRISGAKKTAEYIGYSLLTAGIWLAALVFFFKTNGAFSVPKVNPAYYREFLKQFQSAGYAAWKTAAAVMLIAGVLLRVTAVKLTESKQKSRRKHR